MRVDPKANGSASTSLTSPDDSEEGPSMDWGLALNPTDSIKFTVALAAKACASIAALKGHL